MVDVYSGYDEDDFEELVESEESVLPPSAKKPHNRAVSLQATKKKTGGNSILSLPPQSHYKSPQSSSPRERVLSSTRHALRALQNKLTDVERQLTETQKENKLLKRLQARHEKDLGRLQQQEGELPEILQRHGEEVRTVREQLRRSHVANSELRKKLAVMSEKASREEREHKKMEQLVRKKGLKERQLLTWQLQSANEEIAEQRKREQELEKTVEISKKAHSQEMKAVLSKRRETTRELEDCQKTVHKLKWQLREKEKEVEVMNIYSQRIQQTMPRQLPSSLVRPMTDDTMVQTTLTYPPQASIALSLTSTTTETQTQTDPISPLKTTFPISGTSPVTAQIASPPQQHNMMAASGGSISTRSEISPDKQLSTHLSSPSPPPPPPPRTQPTLYGTSPFTSSLTQTTPISTVSVAAKSTPTLTSTTPTITQVTSSTITQTNPTLSRTTLPATQAPPTNTTPTNKTGPVRKISVVLSSSEAAATSERVVRESQEKTDLLKTLFGNTATSGDTPNTSLNQEAKTTENKSFNSSPAVAEAEKDAKKKELLSKLFALDSNSHDGSPQQASQSTPPQSIVQTRGRGEGLRKRESSGSIHSWPDKLQNMHEGKPAFATEQDPYGSRMKKKDSKTFMTELQSSTSSGDLQHRARHGRRAKQPSEEESGSLETGQVRPIFEETRDSEKVKSSATNVFGYQPSFGRPAAQQKRQSEATKRSVNGSSVDVFDFSRGSASKFNNSQQELGGNHSVQRRTVNGIHNVPSTGLGMLPVDDDIEEVVI